MNRLVRRGLLIILLALLLLLLAGATTVLADGYHRVRTGETLFSIGRLYGVNPYYIARVNGLANPNYIRIGQVLYIPGGTCRPRPPVRQLPCYCPGYGWYCNPYWWGCWDP